MKKLSRLFFSLPGFTLVEMMIVIAIIAVLLSIGLPRFNNMLIKAADGATRGNLATIRSAISIYYGDNGNNEYPYDDLSCLTLNMKYLPGLPQTKIQPFHPAGAAVVAESAPTDTGFWSYDNVDTDPAWGNAAVGCTHQDTSNRVWSAS